MKEKNGISKLALALLGSLVLLLFGFYFLKDVHLFKDLICWDEAAYMFTGLNIPKKVTKTWGPIYGAWYLIVALFQKVVFDLNLIKLYFLNFKILAVAGPVLLYIFFLLKKVNPIVAFFIAAGYFISNLNLETWPHISHFCVAVLLFGLIISHFFKSYLLKWLIIITCVFLLTYARPELYLSFMALSMIFIGWLAYKKFSFKVLEYGALALALLFIAGIHLKMGNAMQNKRETNVEEGQIARDVFAFGQHFAINYFEWNDIDQQSWLDWKPHLIENFEVKGSIISTGLTNKKLFFKHLGANIKNYFYFVSDDISNALLYGKIVQLPFWLRILIGGALLAAWLAMGTGLKNAIKELTRSEHGFLLLVFLLFAGPSLVACVLIYPRDHYLLLQMPFYLSVVALIFFRNNSFEWKSSMLSIGIIGVLLFALAPKKANINFFDLWQDRNVTYNFLAIQELKKMNLEKCGEQPCKILENEGGLSILAENRNLMTFLPIPNKEKLTLAEYFEKHEIRMIFITESMAKDPALIEFPEWEGFINDPSLYNFKKHKFGLEQQYFLIKEELI